MRVLYQNSYVTTVKREGDELLASSFFLSSDYEATAALRVDVSSFRVKRARLDIYRSPGNSLNGGKDLPQLEGIEAYFNEAGQLLQAVGNGRKRNSPGPVQRVHQRHHPGGDLRLSRSEAFLHPGHTRSSGSNSTPIPAASTRTWRAPLTPGSGMWATRSARGTCSTAIRAAQFTGSRTAPWWPQVISAIPFTSWGYLVLLQQDGLITGVSGNFIRVPDPVCAESDNHLASLAGKQFTGLSKKDSEPWWEEQEGCMHLLDIANDLRKAATAALGTVFMGTKST